MTALIAAYRRVMQIPPFNVTPNEDRPGFIFFRNLAEMINTIEKRKAVRNGAAILNSRLLVSPRPKIKLMIVVRFKRSNKVMTALAISDLE